MGEKLVQVLLGSRNAAKKRAVEEAFKRFFESVQAGGAEVQSSVAGQPKSLDEIVRGAVNKKYCG